MTPQPPRIATFHVAVESDDEGEMNLWLTTMGETVSLCAEEITKAFEGRIRLIAPLQYGQEVPLIDQPVKDREDV